MQRYFTRCIPGLAALTYSDRLRVLNLDSLEVRRLRADCIMLFKLRAGLVNMNFNEFFVYRSTILNRTLPRLNNISLHRPVYCRDVSKYAFAVRTVDMWNSLPNNVVECVNLSSFVNALSSSSSLTFFVRGRAFN